MWPEHRALKTLLPALLLTLLAACGGGGGDAPPGPTTFTLGGTASAPSTTAFDSDTNDTESPVTANDTLATAQAVSNPVIVGGHLNEAQQGNPGQTFVNGDTRDIYSAALLAGQIVSLSIAGDGASDDIDMLLVDENGFIVDFSLGITKFERITVPASGNFFVVLDIFQGASNYVLSIGLETSATHAAPGGPEWVPGVLILKTRTGNTAQAAGLLSRTLGVAVQERAFLYRPDAKLAQRFAAASGRALASGTLQDAPFDRDPRLQTARTAKALSTLPGIEYAALNYVRRPALVPDDPFFNLQWHYELINLPTAWDLVPANPAPAVIVAVIDTGIVSSHPDLQNRLVPGFDFISDLLSADDGDGIDPDPEDPGDGAFFGQPSSWHGTHVAGTVAAETDNDEGVAGVALNARIMPLRVLGAFGGTDFDIGQAMLFAAGLGNNSGTLPAQPADVINLSLGGAGASAFLDQVVADVRNAGVVVVAAAGNSATDAPFIPASIDGVLGVSAVTIEQELAVYSNFGPAIDVAAPGGSTTDLNGDGFPDGVLSTYIDESGPTLQPIYTYLQGTSMAAPHVAGVIALMKSVNPALTPGDIDNLLLAGDLSRDLGAAGRDASFGHGLIDATRAVGRAAELSGSPVPAVGILAVNPTSINLGAIETERTVTLSNIGTDSLNIVSISSDQPWLTLVPGTVDGAGLGTYRALVDRTGLAVGTHSGTVSIVSSNNTLNLNVIMQVLVLGDNVGDLGTQHILLIDPGDRSTVASQVLSPVNGEYGFELVNVPAGTYLLLAGTDSDNDGQVCGEGEACGAFLSLDSPTEITIDGNRSGLDFELTLTSGITDPVPDP